MALLMFDGFETYKSQADTTEGGNWASGGYQMDGTARTGSKSMRGYGNSSSYAILTKDFADPTTIIVGCGVYLSNLSVHPNLIRVEGDAGNTVCELVQDGTGVLQVKDGAGALLFTDSVARLAQAVFYYLELKVTLNGASGLVVLRHNGAEIYNSGAVDVQEGASVGVRRIEFFHSLNSFSNRFLDDVYVCDDSGTTHNDFLGPVRVHLLVPNADDAVQLTPNSGTTNYTQVDDMVGGGDGDTTYVESNVVGEKDIYGLTDLAAEYQNPEAVQLFWRARHDDSSGGASMAAILKSGVTESEGPEKVLTPSYLSYAMPLQATNPDTGAAWTPAEINALQVGAIVKANL